MTDRLVGPGQNKQLNSPAGADPELPPGALHPASRPRPHQPADHRQPARRCVHCGLLSYRLDRAGWCPFCLWELATGRPYIDHDIPAQALGSAAQRQAAQRWGLEPRGTAA